ncbi:MAG: BA14K family protein, partial [Pseudolabrys sp.]
WGWGFGGGLAAGALIGGALAAPYYYGGYYPYAQPYYAPGPGYYAQPYGGDVGDDGVAYCMQRYRTYNPNTGTFTGNDGRQHPCP